MLTSEWTCSIFGLHTAPHKQRKDLREGAQISIRTGILLVLFHRQQHWHLKGTEGNGLKQH